MRNAIERAAAARPRGATSLRMIRPPAAGANPPVGLAVPRVPLA
jgi:hypothetical protein